MTNRWHDYGVTQADLERAQQRAAAERERIGLTPAEVDRELADASDATLERLAAAEVRHAVSWQGLEESERKALRARNLLAQRQREAQRQEAQQAEAAKAEAQRAEALAPHIEAFKATARNFYQTEAEFNAAWPGLLRDWQRRRVLEAAERGDAVLEQKRRAYGELL
jgi:phage-related minor tail protein